MRGNGVTVADRKARCPDCLNPLAECVCDIDDPAPPAGSGSVNGMSDQPEPGAREWQPSDLSPEPPDSGPVKIEKWTWTLATTAHESAVELWRDDDHRITIPLTADQTELLLGHPHTLASALEGFPGITEAGG